MDNIEIIVDNVVTNVDVEVQNVVTEIDLIVDYQQKGDDGLSAYELATMEGFE